MSNEVAVIGQQTDVVPYAQLEKMSVTVAKSGLFGVKNPDAAMALFLLAQAEGIHPMTAVRDYHIMEVKGRIIVAMKADAMLARFQQAGGRIDWLALTDVKAEGKLTHPTAGNITITWTIEQAKKAGLTGKDVWTNYPRAMLRSRVISEGIRTLLPGVIAGKYNPEEAMSIETVEPVSVEQAVQSFDRPGLPQSVVDDWMAVIASAADEKSLRTAYQGAFSEAKNARDEQRMGSFTLAYDARKGELSDAATLPVTGEQQI